MKKSLVAALALAGFLSVAPVRADEYLLIVSGLGGEERFTQAFDKEALALYEAAGDLPQSTTHRWLLSGDQSNRDHLLATLGLLDLEDEDNLQVHLIGHGSYDGAVYKYNLYGPDLTAEDLATALDDVGGRQMIALMTSSSGAAMDSLDNGSRIVITATKSGLQKNASVFSRFWAEGATADLADLNKNETVSLDELYQYTQSKVSGYYEDEGLIASESSLLQGSGLDRFNLSRIGKLGANPLNSRAEELLAQRDAVEVRLNDLTERRSSLSEDEYFAELQSLVLELGRLQNQIDFELESGND